MPLPHTDKTTLFIERFRDQLPGWTVLEPGPYNGRHTKILAQHARKVVCVEPRYENCRLVNALALPNVRVIHGDARDMADRIVGECVFHSGVLYHLNLPSEHLRSLTRVAPRLWLNAHHSGERSQWKNEPTHHPRAGLSSWSLWLSRVELLDALSDAGWDWEIVDEHDEENGPRITLNCTLRGHSDDRA